MKVSIIIPTKNRLKILEETIVCLLDKPAYSSETMEILVVNDGDEELDSLAKKYPTLRILKNIGKGAGNARNTGANSATGELLLFLDDDILPGDNCIDSHIELHRKYDHSLVAGSWEYTQQMKAALKLSPFGRYKLLYDYKSPEGDAENEILPGIYHAVSLGSFNLSILRKDFLELGGFNVNFPYAGCEDQEFTMRAGEKGFQLILDTTNVCLNNEKDRLVLYKWLMRQYTGVQGYPLLCELFPFRKEERLYYENIPIRREDSGKLKMKKMAKYILTLNLVLDGILYLTHLMEWLHLNDKTLFKFYRILNGLYLYKGFRSSYLKLHS